VVQPAVPSAYSSESGRTYRLGFLNPSGRDAPHIVALPAVVETNAEGRNGVLVILSDLHIGGDPGQEDFFCHTELIALLDDLDRPAILRLKSDGLAPATIVETSPGNYQAWLRVSQEPIAHEQATMAVVRSARLASSGWSVPSTRKSGHAKRRR